MTASTSAPIPGETDETSIRVAFRELHGRRLYGFALLLTLGDRGWAARLAGNALAAAAARSNELRHPERAAAWLRAHVVASLPRRTRELQPAEARVALEPLGVDHAVIEGLATLTIRERAALVAADVEHLDRRDVEAIVGRAGVALERLLVHARGRYLDAQAVAAAGTDRADGPLIARIHADARRALA